MGIFKKLKNISEDISFSRTKNALSSLKDFDNKKSKLITYGLNIYNALIRGENSANQKLAVNFKELLSLNDKFEKFVKDNKNKLAELNNSLTELTSSNTKSAKYVFKGNVFERIDIFNHNLINVLSFFNQKDYKGYLDLRNQAIGKLTKYKEALTNISNIKPESIEDVDTNYNDLLTKFDAMNNSFNFLDTKKDEASNLIVNLTDNFKTPKISVNDFKKNIETIKISLDVLNDTNESIKRNADEIKTASVDLSQSINVLRSELGSYIDSYSAFFSSDEEFKKAFLTLKGADWYSTGVNLVKNYGIFLNTVIESLRNNEDKLAQPLRNLLIYI